MAFFAGLYLWGLAFGSCLWPTLPLGFRLTLALFWGFVGWSAFVLVFLGIGVGCQLTTMVLAVGITGGAMSACGIRRGAGKAAKEIAASAIGVLVIMGVVWAAWTVNLGVICYDSVPQLFISREVAASGSLGRIGPLLGSWGLLLILVHSAAPLIGREYLLAAQPLIGIASLGLLGTLSFNCLRVLSVSHKAAVGLAMLLCGAWVSTYFILFEFFLIHNNMLAAAYFLCAVGALWISLARRDPVFEEVGVLAVTCYCFTRIEAPIFAAMVLLLYSSLSARLTQHWRLWCSGGCLTVCLWYLWLAKSVSSGNDILTPAKAAIIVLVMLVSGLLCSTKFLYSLGSKINLFKYGMICLFLILLFMFISKPAHMGKSLFAMVSNLAATGRWGWTWLILGGILVSCISRQWFAGGALWAGALFGGLGVLLALAYFRVPYHVGWPDSANRISTQFVAVALVFIALNFCSSSRLSDINTRTNELTTQA